MGDICTALRASGGPERVRMRHKLDRGSAPCPPGTAVPVVWVTKKPIGWGLAGSYVGPDGWVGGERLPSSSFIKQGPQHTWQFEGRHRKTNAPVARECLKQRAMSGAPVVVSWRCGPGDHDIPVVGLCLCGWRCGAPAADTELRRLLAHPPPRCACGKCGRGEVWFLNTTRRSASLSSARGAEWSDVPVGKRLD